MSENEIEVEEKVNKADMGKHLRDIKNKSTEKQGKIDELYDEYKNTIDDWELQLFYDEESDMYDLVDGQYCHMFCDDIDKVEEELKKLKNKEE